MTQTDFSTATDDELALAGAGVLHEVERRLKAAKRSRALRKVEKAHRDLAAVAGDLVGGGLIQPFSTPGGKDVPPATPGAV